MKVVEHSIMSAIEAGGEDALILADGFSRAMPVSQIGPIHGSEHLAIAPDGPTEQQQPGRV